MRAEPWMDKTPEQWRAERRAENAQRPKFRFVFERDWCCGPNVYAIGLLWGRRLDAEPGDQLYRKRFVLRLRFKLWLERSR